MIEKLADIPPGIDALKVVVKISKEDYEKVIELLLARRLLKVAAFDYSSKWARSTRASPRA